MCQYIRKGNLKYANFPSHSFLLVFKTGTTFVPQMQKTDMKSFHNALLQVTTLYVSNVFSTGPADLEHPAKIPYLFIWKYNTNGHSYCYIPNMLPPLKLSWCPACAVLLCGVCSSCVYLLFSFSHSIKTLLLCILQLLLCKDTQDFLQLLQSENKHKI